MKEDSLNDRQQRSGVLGQGAGASGAVWRGVLAADRRECGRQLLHRCRRPPDPGFHLGPDERHPGPQPSRDRRGRAPLDRRARSSLFDHPVAARRRPRGADRQHLAGPARPRAAGLDRRGVQRGGAAHGQAGDRAARDRGDEPLVARRDRRGCVGDLLLEPQGLRPAAPRRAGAAGARQLPLALHRRARRLRLAERARLRLRASGPPVERRAGRLHRRADPELGRRARAAGRLHRGAGREMPRT